MAKPTAVWGIEIGQSALKALRCRVEGGEVVADAFDFIEYPKILSQPEADPEALVKEALTKFLERNETRGDHIAVSVPGQTGLAKFFKPPPVEAKKIADIVKYEARQQIPFDLEDVVWDYQMMPGSTIEEGYALETEIGLFAMKRDQAYRQLKPFDDVGLEVDTIQLAPLALYNMMVYDRLSDRIENETFDPDAPPSSTVLLSLGTDTTDLIVTNGFRIWQRSMPLGGNHFTRQLTKDLKLTFAKAEHLKRNARAAEDPKLIFQTMRPVFNDLVTEVQRSVGFFQSINKKAKIEQLILAGNTVKLPGLSAYLGKNLGYDVHTLDGFQRLSGSEVTDAPAFKDNVYSYGVCYGLCLQALSRGPLSTTLVPEEILSARLIRSKKPWVLAAAAVLMIGVAGYYAMVQRQWDVAHLDKWQTALNEVKQTKTYSDGLKSADGKQTSELAFLKKVGEEVSGNMDRRLLWLELMKAVHAAIPRTQLIDGEMPSIEDMPLEDRGDIYITSVDTRKVEDAAAEWFTERMKLKWVEEMRDWQRTTKKMLPEGFGEGESTDVITGPEGPGWIITLTGYHYHNGKEKQGDEGGTYVRRTLMNNLMENSVDLPIGDGLMKNFTMEEMGIFFPILLSDPPPTKFNAPNPDYEPPDNATGGMGGYGGMGGSGMGGPGMGMGGSGMGMGGSGMGGPGMGMGGSGMGMGGSGMGGPGMGMGGSGMGGPGMGMGGSGMGMGGSGTGDGERELDITEKPTLEVMRFPVSFQFFWKPSPLKARLEAKIEAAKAAEIEGEATPAEDEVVGDSVAMRG